MEIPGNVVCSSDLQSSCDGRDGEWEVGMGSANTHNEGRKEESKPNHFPAVGQMAEAAAAAVHLPWGLRADRGTLCEGEKSGL